MTEQEPISTREAGRRGGRKTAERHGKAHFSRAGKLGGAANAAKHSREHFVEIGRMGGRKVSELIALGKQRAEQAQEQTESKPE